MYRIRCHLRNNTAYLSTCITDDNMKAPDKIYLYPYLDGYVWDIKEYDNSIEYRRVDEENQKSLAVDLLDEFTKDFYHGDFDKLTADILKSKYTIIRNK